MGVGHKTVKGGVMTKREYEGKVVKVKSHFKEEFDEFLILRTLQPAGESYHYEVYCGNGPPSRHTFAKYRGNSRPVLERIAKDLNVPLPLPAPSQRKPTTVQFGNCIWENI